MARLHLTVLGGFQLRVESRTIAVPAKKARALLAYLASRGDLPQSRETLVGLLWGDVTETRARHSLRQTVFRLRQTFARAKNPGLVVDGDTVALDTAAVSVDAVEFQHLLRRRTPGTLEAAVALYQGTLLEGVHVAEPVFEEWLAAERERLRGLALDALAKLLDDQVKRGPAEAAVQTAARLLAMDPLQEPIHRTLMLLYARQGRRADALRQYQTCVGVLQRELAVEPEPETRQVYQGILQKRAISVPALAPSRGPRRAPPGGRSETRGLELQIIGRQMEIARLHRAFDEARGGNGRATVILGEAGIGKTRLLEELASAAVRRGGRVVVSRCYETEQILPFGPWVEALRTAPLEMFDPLSKRELARLMPELAEPGQGPAEPADDYLRLFGAVSRVVESLAAASPLVLIVEDLHWADEMSVRLFGFVARRIEALPCLLIASVRTEEMAEASLFRRLLDELRQQRQTTLLTLAPLSKAETHRLVEMLAGAGTQRDVLHGVAEQVWALSEGNPFVAVETMHALHGGHRFDPSTIGLPGRVREAIGSRIERMSSRARDLLAVAAVIGREFEFSLLQRAGHSDAQEAAGCVEELVRRGVLHAVGAQLGFSHDRIREVAYDAIFAPRRAQLHAAVGEAIEAVHASELAPHHGTLGWHYRRGEIWDKAFRYLRLAGAGAVACSANREALTYVEQALQVLEHLSEGPTRSTQAYNVTMYRMAVLYSLGDLRRIVSGIDEAAALAHALNDPLREGWVDVVRLGCFAAMGQQTLAVASGERALAIGEATGDLPLQASATYLLGFSHSGRGDFMRAVTSFRQAAAALHGQPAQKRFGQVTPPAVLWRAWMIVPLAELGRFDDAVTLGEEALTIATNSAQPYALAITHGALGHCHCARGGHSAGVAVLERSVGLCRDYDIAVLSPWTIALLGHAYAMSGRVSEGIALLEEAATRSESFDVMWWHSRRIAQLAEAYWIAGRLDAARATAERAITLAETHGERGNHAHALRALGEITNTEAHLRAALALADELGMRPLAARCHLDLGRLHRRAEDRAKARELLTAAAARLRELDMPRWIEQAEEELALVR